jgi:ubiquinol-cytochrome c reductase core subunit 2
MLSRRLAQSLPSSSRGYATKVTAIASEGKVSTLTVKVNAGSRYATKDGVSHLLSRFNFQNTRSRSALRLARESELLGGEFSSTVDRDAIYLSANFLKEGLPYYVNAIADVLYKTSFRPHELPEVVLPAASYDLATALASPYYKADELLHSASFRSGLGNPLYYDGVEKVTLDDIKAFSDKVYVKENIEIFAKGVDGKALDGFVKDSALYQLPAGSSLAASAAPKFYEGVETRQRATGESVAAIAVPVKPEQFATFEVLASYLTSPLTELSQSVSKATLNRYSQAGLFTLFVKGDAASVSANIKKVVSALKGGLDLSSATGYASVKLALANESAIAPVELDLAKVKDFKLAKFNYVALGDVSQLPYADEL